MGRPLATTRATGTTLSPFPLPPSPSSSHSASAAMSARYASSLAPPRNAQRYSPAPAILTRRWPPRSVSNSTGRAGPRRARRAVSATTVELSGVVGASAASGGSESHVTPASAKLSGDAGGGSAYQSPATAAPLDQRSTAGGRPNAPGSPPSTTSRAPASARRTSSGATGVRVTASRQGAPFSGCTNMRSGTRATSPSVRARNRRSQSGGAASTTTCGAELSSTTNRRASSRGSESGAPSRRTSSADQPTCGIRETGNERSVETTPLSGRETARDTSRRPPDTTANVASPFPLPVSRFPAVPYETFSRIVSVAVTRSGPSTAATNASRNGARGSTTTCGARSRSGATAATSSSSPSVTTATGAPRAAAAARPGASRLAPSVGGNESKAATRSPNRQ